MENVLGGNNGPPDTRSGSEPIREIGGRLLRDEPARHSRGLAKRRPISIHGGSRARQAARHVPRAHRRAEAGDAHNCTRPNLTDALVWRGARTSRAGITGRPAAWGAPALD